MLIFADSKDFISVYDFIERYRYLIDDFSIDYCRNLRTKDFTVKTENITIKRKRKREYLNNNYTRKLMSGSIRSLIILHC